MYLLYEHHFSADGAILGTDMCMSSYFPGRKGINWKSPEDKAVFEYSKIVFKNVHIAQRAYDDKSNVWSFLGLEGKKVYETLINSPIVRVGLKFERVELLLEQATDGYIKKPTASSWNANDFFYNSQGTPVGIVLTKETLAAKLAPLLLLPEADLLTANIAALKKPYRAAALRLHPDRNSGDGSAMSELNSLWQQLLPFLGEKEQKI